MIEKNARLTRATRYLLLNSVFIKTPKDVQFNNRPGKTDPSKNTQFLRPVRQVSGTVRAKKLRTLVQLGHDEFTMTKYFCCCQTTIGGANHHVKQLVSSLVKIHLASNKT